jgi:hypothetical protein
MPRTCSLSSLSTSRARRSRSLATCGWGGVVGQRPVAQQAQGDAVERAGLDGLADVEPSQPPLQLAAASRVKVSASTCCGIGGALRHAVGDAPGEHRGLARPGRRDDGERRRVGGDGLALFGVEAVQQRVGGTASR